MLNSCKISGDLLAITVMSVTSCTSNFANAHSVFAKFWALKFPKSSNTLPATAFINTLSSSSTLANAHTVFAKSRALKSPAHQVRTFAPVPLR